MSIEIREGKKTDLPRVLELIKELAEYERAPQEVINTVAKMEEDGFGKIRSMDFTLLNVNQNCRNFSLLLAILNMEGKRLYLEDIVVTESERGKGAGKLLFDRTMEKALEEKCSGMMWQVLEWNEPAINFYKKYGAKLDDEWTNCTLEASQIRDILKR